MSKELYNYIMKGCAGSKIKREQGGKSFWQTGMCGRGTTVKVGYGHVQQIQKASERFAWPLISEPQIRNLFLHFFATIKPTAAIGSIGDCRKDKEMIVTCMLFCGHCSWTNSCTQVHADMKDLKSRNRLILIQCWVLWTDLQISCTDICCRGVRWCPTSHVGLC